MIDLLSRLSYAFCLLVSVESTGALSPDMLVMEAVRVLREKCKTFKQDLDVLSNQDTDT